MRMRNELAQLVATALALSVAIALGIGGAIVTIAIFLGL